MCYACKGLDSVLRILMGWLSQIRRLSSEPVAHILCLKDLL